MKTLFFQSSATISDCGAYRYVLRRLFDAGPDEMNRKLLVWIMLNPSTADAENDDPTIRRCMSFAADWGYDGIVVVNLFAFRATYPNDLHNQDDPVGPENDDAIATECAGRDVIAAWGVMGTFRDREAKVMALLNEWKIKPMCLGVTKYGRPRHPLYVAGVTKPQPFALPSVG